MRWVAPDLLGVVFVAEQAGLTTHPFNQRVWLLLNSGKLVGEAVEMEIGNYHPT